MPLQANSSTCFLEIDAKRADGSVFIIATKSDLKDKPYPYVFNSVGSVHTPAITDLRVRIRSADTAFTPIVQAWVPVTDPYPAPETVLDINSIGRSETTGEFTWNFDVSASNFGLRDGTCPYGYTPNSYNCYLEVQAKRVDGTVIVLDSKNNLKDKPYPYEFNSVGAKHTTEVTGRSDPDLQCGRYSPCHRAGLDPGRRSVSHS